MASRPGRRSSTPRVYASSSWTNCCVSALSPFSSQRNGSAILCPCRVSSTATGLGLGAAGTSLFTVLGVALFPANAKVATTEDENRTKKSNECKRNAPGIVNLTWEGLIWIQSLPELDGPGTSLSWSSVLVLVTHLSVKAVQNGLI